MTGEPPTERSFTVAPASGDGDIAAVRALFQDYAASLGIDLGYQDFAAELASLPGRYAAPPGCLLIARDDRGEPAGCVALRPLAPGVGEVKRLYVCAAARGHAIGRRLATAVIAHAKGAGYARLQLDTLASMAAAQALYGSLGFRPIAAYYASPVPDTRYFALDL